MNLKSLSIRIDRLNAVVSRQVKLGGVPWEVGILPRRLPLPGSSFNTVNIIARALQSPNSANVLQTMAASPTSQISLPRVAITYCTQCRWMLRAAWMGQELLTTFGTSIGEVALIPATGGIFTVHLTCKPAGIGSSSGGSGEEAHVERLLIWDRKAEGGFPEAKILKQKIRNHIDPGKGLGHSDTPSKNKTGSTDDANANGGTEGHDARGTSIAEESSPGTKECEDCK